MKLKKNLITVIIAISVLVSTTSYADDKADPQIKVDENALSKMATKVDENTIITEEGTHIQKGDLRDSQEVDKKQAEEGPKAKENPESTENPEGSGKQEKPKGEKSENPDNPDKQEKSEEGKTDKEKTEEKAKTDKASEEKDADKSTGKTEEDNKEKIDTIVQAPDKKNQSIVQKTEEKNNTSIPKIESMDRLENIQKEESNQRVYIQDEKIKTGTLQKLTSKETLITDFKDKGSNLRLNLASTSEEDLKNAKSQSQYVIRPQTLIILIAILAAIFSAISIAIRGNRIKK